MLPISGGSFGSEGTISLHKPTGEISVSGSSNAKYKVEDVFQIKSEPLVKRQFHLPTFFATLLLLGGLLSFGLFNIAGLIGGSIGGAIGLIFAVIWGRRKTLYYTTKITFGDTKTVSVVHAPGEMRHYVDMAKTADIEEPK